MQKKVFEPFKHLNIKNIIFDLGGVVLDIDVDKTYTEFEKLGLNNFQHSLVSTGLSQLFDKFDCGFVSPNQFRNEFKSKTIQGLTDNQIDIAWNALLLNWDITRLELLKQLKQHYQIYLLSNTNEIHSIHYNDRLEKLTNGKNLKNFFDKVYYSYEVGLRKPNPEIFQLVLKENGLTPNETLFIDDTMEHVESAQKLGINAYQIKPKQGEYITQLFK